MLYWVISLACMTSLVIFSIRAFLEYTEISIEGNRAAEVFIAPTQYLESVLFGSFFGIWFIVVNRLTDHWQFEKMGFGRTILAKSGIYLLGFVLIVVLVYQIIKSLDYYPEDVLSKVASGSTITLMIAGILFIIIIQYLLFLFIMNY